MKRATHRFATAGEVAVISIHALVKRATFITRYLPHFFGYFNPRPREEGDGKICCFGKVAVYFNPRPREEGDRYRPCRICWCCCISIHALVKRATARPALNASIAAYFNPRPREEGDLLVLQISLRQCHFNPRPREEGDYCPST